VFDMALKIQKIYGMRSINFGIFLFLLLISNLEVLAQKQSDYLAAEEKKLNALSLKIVNAKADYERYEANEAFLSGLINCLKTEKSFAYPFDSIKAISIVSSDDKKIRIFSWAVPKEDGTYEYFGIIQSYNERSKNYDIHILQDKSEEIKNPESQALKTEFWYGCVYTEIIQVKSNSRTYYTLIGWDGHTAITNSKLIEVVYLKSNGEALFGAPIFRSYKKGRIRRVIFIYAEQSNMLLSYEKQSYIEKKRRFFNRNKRIDKVRSRYMIVFDKLAPMDESLEGQYQFYVPETNLHDAFVLENGKWKYIEMIDARNPKDKEKDEEIEIKRKNSTEEDKSFKLYSPVQ
jgi:hypothetical protein